MEGRAYRRGMQVVGTADRDRSSGVVAGVLVALCALGCVSLTSPTVRLSEHLPTGPRAQVALPMIVPAMSGPPALEAGSGHSTADGAGAPTPACRTAPQSRPTSGGVRVPNGLLRSAYPKQDLIVAKAPGGEAYSSRSVLICRW
jgi:hypothetical protein